MLNSGIANICCYNQSRQANCGQCYDFLVHDITIKNNKVSSTAFILKYTGLYLRLFRVAIFLNTAECAQRFITCPTVMYQLSFQRLFCVCADKQNDYASSVGGIDLGICLPVVSGISLMTTIKHLCVTFLLLLQFTLTGIKLYL